MTTLMSWTQIFQPEGMNMPGDWTNWSNPPASYPQWGSSSQVSGGTFTFISTGLPRFQTTFATDNAFGGAGTKGWLFTSGPSGSPYNNKWGGVTVTPNVIQSYTKEGANNSMTITAGKFYTVNFMDNNYTNTEAIFMETSAMPVTFSSVVQSPLNGSVDDDENVIVTVTASATPSAEEKVYLRYAINGNFAASTQVLVNFTGNVGTAQIPMQSAATVVSYYVFSTTVTNPAIADIDKVTMRFRNAEPGNFTYTVNTALDPVNVTFRVNMSQQTVTPPVRVWTSTNGLVTMTSEGGGLYATTISMNQGTNVEYKFVNDNTYEGNLGAPCGNGTNRTFTVNNSNILTETIPTACFGLCTDCPPTSLVTFRVNMSAQYVSGDVFVNGNFPPANWTTPQQMTAIGGGVYEYSVTLAEGLAFEYKFINGSNYEGNLSAPCGNGNNRTHTVGVSDEVLSPVCFGSCDVCPTAVAITFRVNMSEEVVSNDEVYINGSFPPASWTTPQLMTPVGGGVYSYTTNLVPGANFEYKFINDPTFEGDLGAPCGNGVNRTITVPGTPTSLPIVCFGQCINCAEVIPTQAVTFRVNMANVAVSNFGVHLAGNFGNAGYPEWVPSGINMTDANFDGIYEVTLQLNQNTAYQYKFINGNNWGMDESVPGDCQFNNNRLVNVVTSDISIAAVCFASCSNCANLGNNDGFYNATPAPATGISFPGSQCYNGTLLGATVSPQGNAASVLPAGGQDRWHRIIAPSSALRVITTSGTVDVVLEIHNAYGTLIDIENEVVGAGGETMLATGLTPGAAYFIGIRSYDGVLGSYTLCLQTLLASFATGVTGPLELCTNLKPQWTGATNYTYIFTGTGATPVGPTQVTVASQVPLSTAALALRYGGTYDVRIDANYTGLGVTVPGTVITPITIANHAAMDTKATQACPATLLRGSILSGKPFVCGATNFTVSFQRISACSNGTYVDPMPFEVTTTGASSNLYLNFTSPQQLVAQSWYEVRWRPNFSYGNGTYGAPKIIFIGGSVLENEVALNELVADTQKSDVTSIEANIYPNPSSGEMINLNLTDIESDNVFVRVMDSMGRVVYSSRYSVDGSLNTLITFAKPLADGLYLVEMTAGNRVITERMIVK